MRFKALVTVLLMTSCIATIGCGGGGGGGSNGGTTPPATVTVSGGLALPAGTNAGWSASLRYDVVFTTMSARAVGKNGNSLGDGRMLDSNGSFTLSITPDSEVLIEITNSKGFKFQNLLGNVSGEKTGVLVDEISTAKAMLNRGRSAAVSLEGTKAVQDIVDAIKTLLVVAPASGDPFATVQTKATNLFDTLSQDVTEIRNRNALVEQALRGERLADATPYFSGQFGSSDPSLTGVNLDNFKTVTQSRFDLYTITTYSFIIKDISFTATDTAKVKVDAHVQAKGAGGLDKEATLNNYPIIWRMEDDGWVIYRDFPYRTDQIF